MTNRDQHTIELVEAYAKEQGLFRTDETPDPAVSPTRSNSISRPWCRRMAGPKRPQDRIDSARREEEFSRRVQGCADKEGEDRYSRRKCRDVQRRGRDRRDYELHQYIESVGDDRRRAAGEEGGREGTEESKPWVKTSLAPGSKVVMDYLNEAGLTAVSGGSEVPSGGLSAARPASATAVRCRKRWPRR